MPWLIKIAVAEKDILWRAGLAMLCLVTSKAAGLMCPILFKGAIDSFTAHAGAPLGVALQFATQFLLWYGLCDVLKHVSKELQAPLFTPLSQAASRRVAYHAFSHVLGMDIRFHLDRRTGRLSRILERGTRSIQLLFRAIFFTFVPTALELVFVCGVLARNFSPLVAAGAVATFAAYVVWSVIMTQAATDARRRVVELDNATGAKAVDALLSYETVTLFNNQGLETRQYHQYLRAYQKASITTDQLSAILNAGQAVVLAVGLAGIMILALHTSGGRATAGDLVMIQGLLLQLWAPLQFLGWFYRELRSALVDMEDLFSILRTDPSIKSGRVRLPPTPPTHTTTTTTTSNRVSGGGKMSEAAATTGVHAGNGNGVHTTTGSVSTPAPPPVIDLTATTTDTTPAPVTAAGPAPSARDRVAGGGAWEGSPPPQDEAAVAARAAQVAGWNVQGNGLLVELDGVTFGYNPDRQILQGLTLSVAPGKSLALVGPSGSGKSTVLKLLTRLYDVDSGHVALNGVDVRDLTLTSLRGSVAVVPQETMLFNETIMNNIRYGRPDASDSEVVEAARLAHLDEAVGRMPQGYNTVVGERGLKLSGGEKQRVAIARAFLRQPRLLICDEATSALDSATEAAIMTSLSELAVGRTSVFVAHRLSTVKGCDTIAVLKEGRVVELGSHEQLMTKPHGVYAGMWQLQAAEEAAEKVLESEGTDPVASRAPPAARATSVGSAMSSVGGAGSQDGEDGPHTPGKGGPGADTDSSEEESVEEVLAAVA